MANNPFYSVLLHNKTDADVEFRLAPEDGPLPDQVPVKLKNGTFGITIIQPQDDMRHKVLGRFMDEWSKVEMQLARLLALAVSLNQQEVAVLMNGLGNRGQREAIEDLLPPRLKPEAAERLSAALGNLKSNATKRNYIVHGYWALEVVISDRNGVPWPNYRQYRRYDPSSATIRHELDQRTNSQARKTYMFSLTRIEAISAGLVRLWDQLAAITERDLKQPRNKPVNFTIDTRISPAWVRP